MIIQYVKKKKMVSRFQKRVQGLLELKKAFENFLMFAFNILNV